VEVEEFVLAELPDAPARVLEVGCGAGELACALAAAGYSVLAIDPVAPDGPLFRRSTIEDLEERGKFDAVVASSSLHHVSELALALDKMAAALEPGGVLVIDDFAWELLDAASAERVGIPYVDWREEHQRLHTSQAMLDALDARFDRRSFSRNPYLHREGHLAVTEEQERRLIADEELAPIGFRYVGIPVATVQP
jgi:SAM-dependent methyltransferase